MNKRSYSLFYIFLFAITLSACRSPESHVSEWRLVFRNDAEGNAVYGSKEKLINAVRNGLPVRIGFGGRSRVDSTRSVEHLADAQFLSIIDNEEVFAQITPIIGQAPGRDESGIKIRFRTNNKWTMIRGTNGYSTSMMIDYMSDTLVGAPRDGQRGASWFVNYGRTIKKKRPLYD